MTDPVSPASAVAEGEDGMPFPTKLYHLLVEAGEELEDVVAFQPHGRAFRILDQTRFCQEILPV